MPSSMNGNRIKLFVAPTSFITSISRRRANIATRIELKMSITLAPDSTIDSRSTMPWNDVNQVRMASTSSRPVWTDITPGR